MNSKKSVIKNIIIGTTVSIVSCATLSLIPPEEVSACPGFKFPLTKFFNRILGRSSSANITTSSSRSTLSGINNSGFTGDTSNGNQGIPGGILKTQNSGNLGDKKDKKVTFSDTSGIVTFEKGDSPSNLNPVGNQVLQNTNFTEGNNKYLDLFKNASK